MRHANFNILTADDSVSQNSSQIDSNQTIAISFHAFFGDATATGSVKIQASNDIDDNGPQTPFTVTNWVDVPSATASVASGAAVLITVAQPSYRWMRAVYTRSGGGSTTITINVNLLSM